MRHIHKLHILALINNTACLKKVSLFDLMYVGNDSICRICFLYFMSPILQYEVLHKAIQNQLKFCQAETTAFANLITK